MSLTCYIVDDEFHAVEILEEYIRMTPGLELLSASTQPLQALEEITAGRPAITFLDIDMPGINGLDFAGLVNSLTSIVFTTSYRDYAPEAFAKEAADYLLKPIAYERFLQAVQKIRKNGPPTGVLPQLPSASFFIKTGIRGQLFRVVIPEIMYISSALNYIELHFKEQKLMTYLSIAEILEKLPPESFSRIHKGFIINHNFIRSVEYAQVKLQDQTILPIGRAFRGSFRQKIMTGTLVSKWDQSESSA
jgi:two-component system LytT family response regulator